jgi:hypothetical protein
MNTSKNNNLSYGDLIARLTQLETEGHSFSEAKIQELFTELKLLLDESIRELKSKSSAALVDQIDVPQKKDARDVEKHDSAEIGLTKSSDDFIREIDTLRMRMMSVLVMGSRDRFPIQEGLLPTLTGALVTTPGGITYGTVEGHCIALLPSFERAEQETYFGRDMLEVHDFAIKTQGLVIDCSAVKRLPLMVQAVLLGYRHTLFSQGKDFSLVWLHIGAVEPQLQKNVAQVFRGEFIGEYLFTRRE